MRIHGCDSREEALETAADLLASLLFQYEREQVLFLTSGGSAMSILDQVPVHGARQLTVGVLDERYRRQRAENNFLQFQQTEFFHDAQQQKVRILETVPHRDESLTQFADRMERQLRNWRLAHRDGIIIATMGMGADGHTCGIFPYPEDPEEFHSLFSDDHWVVGYEATGKHQIPERVTPTVTFLKTQVDHAICFVTGEPKANAIERAVQETGSVVETPARVWREMKSVDLVTTLLEQ